jgi:hypothetical protein
MEAARGATWASSMLVENRPGVLAVISEPARVRSSFVPGFSHLPVRIAV